MSKPIQPPAPPAAEPLVWVLDSAYTGELGARVGVAERLGYGYDTIPLPGTDAAAYARMLRARYQLACGAGGERSLVLLSGTGEDTLGPVADLRHDFDGRLLNVFLASILPDPPDPRLHEYDLIASPQIQGDKVVTTLGVAHKLNPARLEAARRAHADRFAGLERPLVGLLVGGNTRYCAGFDVAHAQALGRKTRRVVESLGGSLVATNSRRTPADAWAALLAEFDGLDRRCFDWRQDPGLYPALLAEGDVFIATGDSISMCSEASHTGKPLLVDLAESATESFHRAIVGKLLEYGAARHLDGGFEPWTYTPPDPAGAVAAAIQELLDRKAPRVLQAEKAR
ncbi:ELM1/GtrOC1 family putative glycosyltransferase [Methylomagnum ishizawai]|uniref:ELM1/GtrOC1 family putative glycosyltransferase n=1 Tax=Methylomagnum ishizawai TaxID=1760988 RepID=UPI001C322F9C|nr:ELM1/GtrOC1 family putative glycosyltransferase [Methylomagnum ishizawai]BBL76641.1 hypothetical protein MishRS11D_37390 [Methylomagnum ishizawai]